MEAAGHRSRRHVVVAFPPLLRHVSRRERNVRHVCSSQRNIQNVRQAPVTRCAASRARRSQSKSTDLANRGAAKPAPRARPVFHVNPLRCSSSGIDGLGRIFKVPLDGTVLGVIGRSRRNLGQFSGAHALACPTERELYVAETSTGGCRSCSCADVQRTPRFIHTAVLLAGITARSGIHAAEHRFQRLRSRHSSRTQSTP